MRRKLADQFLFFAECLFLWAHGWHRVGGCWDPPLDYPGKAHERSHGHAVNSQKFYTRNPLMRMAARMERES